MGFLSFTILPRPSLRVVEVVDVEMGIGVEVVVTGVNVGLETGVVLSIGVDALVATVGVGIGIGVNWKALVDGSASGSSCLISADGLRLEPTGT